MNDKDNKKRTTTLWVSLKTWKYLKNNRILGESTDQVIQRLLGIQDTNDNEQTPFMVIKKNG